MTAPTPGPIDPQTGFQTHESGTYYVNPDCTGNAEIHFAPPPVPGATGAVIKLLLVIGSQGNVLRTVVVSMTPPSVIPNDIPGFTLHSEGSKLGQLQENATEGPARGGEPCDLLPRRLSPQAHHYRTWSNRGTVLKQNLDL